MIDGITLDMILEEENLENCYNFNEKIVRNRLWRVHFFKLSAIPVPDH